MNRPPTDGVIVKMKDLHELIRRIFAAVPIPEEHAGLIADMMIDTDLRGVVSHGVLQVKRYFSDFRAGATNANPQLHILREAPGTVALNGDGGLGYIAGHMAMSMSIEKARSTGVGVATTTYHEHIGSAGKYVRLAMREGMVAFCSSGRPSRTFPPEAMINSSADSAPFAFGIPAGPEHPDLLCDFASSVPFDEDFFATQPQIFFRLIGISHLANMLSGTLGGQMREWDPEASRYPVANQSGFYLALAVENFLPFEEFAADIDGTMASVSRMRPYPGLAKAQLPGGPELDCERAYRRDGIPVCAEAQQNLEEIAAETGLRVPW